jgi:hypothetical protein
MGMPQGSIPTVFCEAFSGSGFGPRALLLLARSIKYTASLARLARHPDFQAFESALFARIFSADPLMVFPSPIGICLIALNGLFILLNPLLGLGI